jgi:hypothetical protein
VQHERGGRGVAAKHLHDGHARRAGRHVHEALELPHAGRVVVSLHQLVAEDVNAFTYQTSFNHKYGNTLCFLGFIILVDIYLNENYGKNYMKESNLFSTKAAFLILVTILFSHYY